MVNLTLPPISLPFSVMDSSAFLFAVNCTCFWCRFALTLRVRVTFYTSFLITYLKCNLPDPHVAECVNLAFVLLCLVYYNILLRGLEKSNLIPLLSLQKAKVIRFASCFDHITPPFQDRVGR